MPKDKKAADKSGGGKGKGKGKGEEADSGGGKVKGALSINVRHILVRMPHPMSSSDLGISPA